MRLIGKSMATVDSPDGIDNSGPKNHSTKRGRTGRVRAPLVEFFQWKEPPKQIA